MDKYEISLWEDYPDLTSDNIPFLNERKLCVIGSDTMTSAARALEPKLVSNVNGTNTFAFRIYYRYNDEITGEERINPYLPYIINERKVKVLWKDVWYDLVIKKIEEDTQKRSVLCICEDLFISELSKNGYELEFNSELQNNSGTASELAEKVLEGSGWRLGNQPNIIQYNEESAYEVEVLNSFSAEIVPKSLTHEGTVFFEEESCLLLTSCLNVNSTEIYFYYTGSDDYLVEEGTSIVTGGQLYSFSGRVEQDEQDEDNNKQISFSIFNEYNVKVFELNLSDYTSSIYKVKRPITSQVTVFDKLLNRYVDVYFNPSNGDTVYGYETTEYTDPSMVVNLIANPKDFKDTNGWIGNDIQWEVYPSFDINTNIQDYNAKSYLKITKGKTYYNTALISNRQYLNPSSTDIREGELGGFQVGDVYIFRYRAFTSSNNIININSIVGGLTANIYDKDGTSKANNTPYFSRIREKITNEWVQLELKCNTACPANKLDSVGLFIDYDENDLFESLDDGKRWLEEIQFFKKVEGKDENGETVILEPGKFNGQSVVKTIYKYYNPEQLDKNGKKIEDPKDLVFLYQGEEKLDIYTPVKTNQKITSIEISKSNRFNILQTIAEKFECWVRFVINHNQQTGQILYDENGLPQKYVKLVEQIGEDTGISFEYGIDLKGIKRTIVSNTIATKAIIIPNENEFGKNGFCTIARSKLNYCRENFILNFDYYIQQGLLNRDAIESDLYKTNGTNLGYYYYLNKFNREYDELADAVNAKQIQLIKQEAEYKVQDDNLRAAQEKLTNSKSDLQILAGVGSFNAAETYAQNHANNTRVQSLMRAIAELNNTISNLRISVDNLETSIDTLKSYIEDRSARMKTLTENITNLHRGFFKKYSRFIQEGTWQDQNYVDDDKYYLDALEVAYRSSRPQIQYDISLVRLSGLEDFSSKTFNLGDICYIQDTEFFGYADESKTTPYKQKIIISQLTSFFDTPEKDIIKVQNYKTQFDDLFQRITTATQALQFSQGKYERAAEVVNPDKTLSFALLQDTFDYNKDLVLNSANQQVVWDNTGITVTDSADSALKVKIMAGGIFASSDGGNTWKNALRGDGISTDLLTAGRINTSEIYVYDGKAPSFRWDSEGINAYYQKTEIDPETSLAEISTLFNKFVRFDKFGLYGYDGTEVFSPATEDAIWAVNSGVKFGLTWKGFFLRGGNNSGSNLEISDDGTGIKFLMNNSINSIDNTSLEISTINDIVLKTGNVNRVQIGRLNPNVSNTLYGIWIRNGSGQSIFKVTSANEDDTIGGWTLTENSFYHRDGNNVIGLYSQGNDKISIQGSTDPLYIVAGSNFGVTIDGKVYASAGKIGGWTIGADSLRATDSNNRSIIINSSGSISVANQTDQQNNVTSGWEIKSDGSATFHNIKADNGTIAGWKFTSTGLYNTLSHTTISSGTYDNTTHFTIDTDSLRAQGGSIGGWKLEPQQISASGIILGSNGTLNLGANGQLIAGNVTIKENEILFKPNADAAPINIGTSYETFVNDHDKLEKVFVQMGLTFNPEDNEVLLFTMANNVNTALSNSQTANSNVASIREWIGYDANGNLDGSNIELFADNIAISSTNNTTIASALITINGRLIADSIDTNGNVTVTKNIIVTGNNHGIYAPNFYEDDGSENPISLANINHKHSLNIDSNGNVTMGIATYDNVTSFNIADTDFFKAQVSAAGGGAAISNIVLGRDEDSMTGLPIGVQTDGEGNKYINVVIYKNEEDFTDGKRYTTKALYNIDDLVAANSGTSNVTGIGARPWDSTAANGIPVNYRTNLAPSQYVDYDNTEKKLRGIITLITSNNSIPAFVEMDASGAYNAGWDYGADTITVLGSDYLTINVSNSHKTSGKHHYVNVNIVPTASTTKSDNTLKTATNSINRDILADDVYSAGVESVNFDDDDVTPTVYSGESDYQLLINDNDYGVGYGTVNNVGYVYGAVNVKLTNDVTKTLYVGIEATKASNAPVSNVTSITKKYWSSSDAENIASNSPNYFASLDSYTHAVYYTSGTTRKLRGLININLSDGDPIPAYIEMDATQAYNDGATSTINITNSDVSPNGAVSSSTNRIWHYYPEYENWIPAEPEIEGQTGYSEYETTYMLPVKATFYVNGTFKSFTDNLNITPYVGSGSSSVALTTLTLNSASDNNTTHTPPPGYSGFSSVTVEIPTGSSATTNWTASVESKNYSGTPTAIVDFDSDDIEYWTSDSKLHGFLRVRRGNSESKVIKLNIDTSHVPTSGGGSNSISISDIKRVYRNNQWSYKDRNNNVHIYVGTKTYGNNNNTADIDVTDIYEDGASSGGNVSHTPTLESRGNAGSAYYVGNNEWFQPVWVVAVCDGQESEKQLFYYYHSSD